MTETPTMSRRNVLKATGAVAAAATTGVAVTSAAAGSTGWTEVSSPTSKSLTDVVQTADGPYAVGASGNVATPVDGTWELVVDSGPSNSNNPLNSVDVTDDGRYIWFAGGSGALGLYDVEKGKKYNYTAPMGKTSTWEGIAVTGPADDETVLVANGSGEVLDGTRDAEDCMKWGEVVKPAGGSTIPELAFARDGSGIAYGVDTSQTAFQSRDANDTWSRIGVENAQVAFYDLVGTGSELYVAGGSGTIYRRDCDCGVWTPIDAGEKAIRSIDRTTDRVIAAGNSGSVYERTGDGWQTREVPVSSDLLGVSYGETDVAVGSGGTIIER